MKDLTSIALKDLLRLSSKDLLAVYNAYAPKPVARFADYPSALRRTKALWESVQTKPKHINKESPMPSQDAPKEVQNTVKKARTKVLVALESNRDAVKEYHSVYAAFVALGLPVAKHQRFRAELKREGSAVFAHYVFIATY